MDMLIISVSIPVSDVFRGYAKKSLGLSAGKIELAFGEWISRAILIAVQ